MARHLRFLRTFKIKKGQAKMAGESGEGFFGRLEDMFSYMKKLEELAEFMEKLGKPKSISELESRLYDFFKKSSRNNLTEAMEKVNTALDGMEDVVLEDKEPDFSKDPSCVTLPSR
ncbi:hypothetical protein HYT92_02875 [Candidatus Pacearchaeota archaeon]|nr:hypothetical protein [Candidatus Pacearchaeota archaeon]